jgi:hypothetical protein
MKNLERGRNVLRHISALLVITLAFGVAADETVLDAAVDVFDDAVLEYH